MQSQSLKNGSQEKGSKQEKEKAVRFNNKETEKSFEKNSEKKEKKGKKWQHKDLEKTELSGQPRDNEGILTSKVRDITLNNY